MPRKRKTVAFVEAPVEPENLPVPLERQGTFTKTPDDKTDAEVQESSSTPPRATRGRTRKNKKSGSPLKPTRTMPKRGRKQVNFSDEVHNIVDVKENEEPVRSAEYASPPKDARKRTRRTKKCKEEPINPQLLVREGTFTKSPENNLTQNLPETRPESPDGKESTCPLSGNSAGGSSATSAAETSKKRSRRGKKSKEELANVQTSAQTDTVSSETGESQQKRGSRGRSGRQKRSKEEPSEPLGIVREGTFTKSPDKALNPESSQKSEEDATPCGTADDVSGNQDVQEAQPSLVREGTFTKSPEKDLKTEPEESPQKANRKRKRTSESTADQPLLTRQGTFTKNSSKRARTSDTIVHETEHEPGSLDSTSTVHTPTRLDSVGETNGSPVLQRRATFTKTPRPSKRCSLIPDQENVPAGIKREGTFTKSFEEEEPVKEGAGTGQTARDASELRRAGKFTKSPEKEADAIPDFQAQIQTPGGIENLSVFERLSTKLPLSVRRSLVSTEKRASLRNKCHTPQIDKKAQLIALREARKNHLTPKSITFKRGTTPTTPVEPVNNKMVSSTKKPKSAVKKAPNFAAIHERNFAKMESLLENKKRLRERANFLLSPSQPAQPSGIPKLVRKASAPVPNAPPKKSLIPIKKMAAKERLKAAVANKCTTGAVLTQESKVLKGVRTNKRFELLLKQKNMKN